MSQTSTAPNATASAAPVFKELSGERSGIRPFRVNFPEAELNDLRAH